MFIEINDISTGTVVNEPLNAYSINYVYGRQNDSGKYNLIYVLDNGIRKIEEFDSQSDLEDKIEEIKNISGGGGAVANVYVYKGSCEFADLPVSGNQVGDVWNITDDFELGGKSYPAGTNVAWDGLGWDALAGSIDLSAYYTKTEVNTLLGDYLKFGGVYGNNPFDTNAHDPGVYFIRTSNFSDGHGHTSNMSNYGLHAGEFFGVLNLVRKYDDAGGTDNTLGYIFGVSSGANNISIICRMYRTGSSTYIGFSGYEPSTTMSFLTTTTNQNNISGKKTFTTLPESSVVPTTDTQLVNKKYVDDNAVSFKPFTNAFPTTGTTQDFLTAVEALNLPTGNVYLGGVTFSDLPFSGNAEIEVYIYPNNVIFCILRSANVAPYIWSCNSHTFRGWEPVGQTIQYSTMPTADSSNADRIVEYVGTTDANYTNGYFYKNIYTPGTYANLTEAEAVSGIDSFTLPETITLSSIPVAGTNIYLTADDIGNVSVDPYEDSGAYYINVTINKLTDTEIHTMVQYGSGDGLNYSLNIGQGGTYTFADNLVLFNSVWDDFVGPILLQETAASYNWQQINVQPASDMSNYYTKAEIDSMLGDIQTVLETLTLPTAVEEELSEI